MEVRHTGTGTKNERKMRQGFFLLIDHLAPDKTEEVKKEKENMSEKWERATVVVTGIEMSIYGV